jgi:hypothetical protein
VRVSDPSEHRRPCDAHARWWQGPQDTGPRTLESEARPLPLTAPEAVPPPLLILSLAFPPPPRRQGPHPPPMPRGIRRSKGGQWIGVSAEVGGRSDIAARPGRGRPTWAHWQTETAHRRPDATVCGTRQRWRTPRWARPTAARRALAGPPSGPQRLQSTALQGYFRAIPVADEAPGGSISSAFPPVVANPPPPPPPRQP